MISGANAAYSAPVHFAVKRQDSIFSPHNISVSNAQFAKLSPHFSFIQVRRFSSQALRPLVVVAAVRAALDVAVMDAASAARWDEINFVKSDSFATDADAPPSATANLSDFSESITGTSSATGAASTAITSSATGVATTAATRGDTDKTGRARAETLLFADTGRATTSAAYKGTNNKAQGKDTSNADKSVFFL